MIWFSKSQPLPVSNKTPLIETDPIYIITQFFIHKDPFRQRELVYCLQKNVSNVHVHQIYLLNERIYTSTELGLTKKQMKKIKQINIKTRILFRHIFDYIETESMNGIIVALNSDIMLDNSIEILRKTTAFQTHPTLITTLRYEYEDVYVPFETNCQQSKLFGPRGDSQDSWIIHSRHNIVPEHRALFDFPFGKPGCDNKMVFLFHYLNYEVYNDPLKIKTYHFHSNPKRDYTIKDRLQPIFEYFGPAEVEDVVYNHAIQNTQNYSRWNFEDNDKFRSMLNGISSPFLFLDLTVASTSSHDSSIDESVMYESCTGYFAPDVYHSSFGSVKDKLMILLRTYPQKQWIWSELQTLSHFRYRNPWTNALTSKRILQITKGDVNKDMDVHESAKEYDVIMIGKHIPNANELGYRYFKEEGKSVLVV
jgi:hypothetical protein